MTTEMQKAPVPLRYRCFPLSGSGGGIRTPDLWVMSPTSCRCSTPRQGPSPALAGEGRPRRPRLPWGRPHSTLRRCTGSRPGSGWVRVGPARSWPRMPLTCPLGRFRVLCFARLPCAMRHRCLGSRLSPAGSSTRPAWSSSCQSRQGVSLLLARAAPVIVFKITWSVKSVFLEPVR